MKIKYVPLNLVLECLRGSGNVETIGTMNLIADKFGIDVERYYIEISIGRFEKELLFKDDKTKIRSFIESQIKNNMDISDHVKLTDIKFNCPTDQTTFRYEVFVGEVPKLDQREFIYETIC